MGQEARQKARARARAGERSHEKACWSAVIDGEELFVPRHWQSMWPEAMSCLCSSIGRACEGAFLFSALAEHVREFVCAQHWHSFGVLSPNRACELLCSALAELSVR